MRIQIFVFLFLSFSALSCNQAQTPRVGEETAQLEPYFVNSAGDTIQRLFKTEDEWKELLSKEEFRILREAGTERAGTGDLLDNKKDGLYTCAACGLVLFSSEAKYNSGSGWPSYYKPYDPAHILEKTDPSYGWNRVELLCARCGGHLGHVFEDGPRPTGLRYCINAASLDFEKEKE